MFIVIWLTIRVFGVTNRLFSILNRVFSGWCFPSFPCSPCSPCSQSFSQQYSMFSHPDWQDGKTCRAPYIVREGSNAIGRGYCTSEQNVGLQIDGWVTDGYPLGTLAKKTLPTAQRTRGLSSYYKITVHGSQILNILQFQNID